MEEIGQPVANRSVGTGNWCRLRDSNTRPHHYELFFVTISESWRESASVGQSVLTPWHRNPFPDTMSGTALDRLSGRFIPRPY